MSWNEIVGAINQCSQRCVMTLRSELRVGEWMPSVNSSDGRVLVVSYVRGIHFAAAPGRCARPAAAPHFDKGCLAPLALPSVLPA